MNTGDNVIHGWELANPDPEKFDIRILEVSEKCKNCEYLDRCNSPVESMRQLIPKKGRLVQLGREQIGDGEIIDYYSLIGEEDARYVLLKQPKYYWATACYVSEDQVPPWMLAALSKPRSEE